MQNGHVHLKRRQKVRFTDHARAKFPQVQGSEITVSDTTFTIREVLKIPHKILQANPGMQWVTLEGFQRRGEDIVVGNHWLMPAK